MRVSTRTNPLPVCKGVIRPINEDYMQSGVIPLPRECSLREKCLYYQDFLNYANIATGEIICRDADLGVLSCFVEVKNASS